jgi:hypothetical protein
MSSASQQPISKLRHALAEAEGAGATVARSRFAEYISVLEAAAAPAPSFSKKGEERHRALIFEAGSQLQQLVLASATFRHLSPPLLRKTLRKVFDGDVFAASEDDKPRSTLLELVTAAVALDFGFTISLTKDLEDVRIEHPAIGQGAIECKRPLRLSGLLQNLQKAGMQLRNREKGGSTFGVVAIGVDRISGLAGAQLSAIDIDEEGAVTDQIIRDVSVAVLDASRDVACGLAPPAVLAIIVLSGAIVLDRPRALRMFSKVGFVPLTTPANIPPALDDLFRRGPAPESPLHNYLVEPVPPGEVPGSGMPK